MNYVPARDFVPDTHANTAGRQQAGVEIQVLRRQRRTRAICSAPAQSICRHIMALFCIRFNVFVVIFLSLAFTADVGRGEPVTVRYREGEMHGFVELQTLEGKNIAYGETIQ